MNPIEQAAAERGEVRAHPHGGWTISVRLDAGSSIETFVGQWRKKKAAETALDEARAKLAGPQQVFDAKLAAAGDHSLDADEEGAPV